MYSNPTYIIWGVLLVKCSLYLSSKFVGKFGGNDVVDI